MDSQLESATILILLNNNSIQMKKSLNLGVNNDKSYYALFLITLKTISYNFGLIQCCLIQCCFSTVRFLKLVWYQLKVSEAKS